MEHLKQLEARVETLEKLLSNTKRMLTMNEVCHLTGLSKATIYIKTSQKEIPHYKPTGGKIYFDRSEIEAWMRSGKVHSNDEVQAMADQIKYQA